MKPQKRLKKRPGVTLVELAISMAIIGIAVVPTATMWLRAAQANETSERTAKAMIVAQLVMESQVRVVSFDDQRSASGTDASGLTYQLTVSNAATNLKRARVAVFWPGQTEAVLELETLTAKEI
jgi:prepilin-type N-terminal cleavage/methylation domain-containing protein